MFLDPTRTGGFMETLAQDLRYVARSFARSPGFFIVTVLTLALGIGATTAIFSVVNGVLLQPLPYPASERIVQLFALDKDGKRTGLSQPNYTDWKAQARGYSAMAIVTPASTVTVNGLAEPARARETSVSREFFDVFGVKPEIGRTFVDEELRPGGSPAVIVSHSFWQKYLGGNATPLGKTLTVEGRQYTIVGVLPDYMNYPAGNELWTPFELNTRGGSRTSGGYRALARLKDGASLEQAQQDLSAVSRRMKEQYGTDTWMSNAESITLHELLVGKIRPTLLVLLGASAFLLLIACANVVNLLVARMTLRRGEIGLRLALGASRGRLAQQFLTESGVLSIIGGLAGIALAAIGVRLLLAMQTTSLPRATEVHVNWRVMLFALGVSVITAIALGLLSAWHGTQSDIRETLSSAQRTQAGSGSSARIRRTLVVSQMALTVVLLVGAGLLGRSFLRLLEIDPGYRVQHAVILDAAIAADGPDGAQQRATFYRNVMARARAIPGVTVVGGVSGFPLLGGGSDGAFITMTRVDEPLRMEDMGALFKDPIRSGYANYMVADGNYFEAMNIPLIRGRLFNSGDVESAPHVGVISASLSKAKWPNENPIGKVVQYGNMDGDLRPFTIVGVVGDVRDQSLASDPGPTFYAYQPQRQHAAQTFHVVMQTAGDPAPVMASARAIVRELRPDVPPVVRTMETVVAASVADRRFVLVLVGVFGGAALLLATLGVYSVISYLVTQRRQEIGVRIALGAQRGDVLSLVLRQGAVLALLGIAIGAAGALFLTRLLKGLVFGVSTTDPVAFVGVIVLLTAVALVASWMPALRATKVDPMDVLRGA
jgi:putative ABC transport system permease protein